MFLENEKKQREFFDVFDGLSPVLQDYLIKTAKDLLETQSKLQAPNELSARDEHIIMQNSQINKLTLFL